MSMPHQNWRDCKAWVDAGLPLSTTSNEAAKMYDACITQYFGLFQTEGGLTECVKKMIAADPDFVMGRVVGIGLELCCSGQAYSNPGLLKDVAIMSELAKKSHLSDRERKHVEAIELWADGHVSDAAGVWQDILLSHPVDALAIRFGHDTLFFLGEAMPRRDMIARVVPFWNKSDPLYGYLIGLHSFGLEEFNYYTEAEALAREGLSINKNDAWSTHTLAHVYEMTDKPSEGIKFMSSTEDNWSRAEMFASHNYWHWALYHIEKGEFEEALGVYDANVVKHVKNGSLLAVTDASSALTRLELEGVKVGHERWDDIYEATRPHLEDHALLWNDVHYMLTCVGAKEKNAAKDFVKSLKEYVGDLKQDNQKASQQFGITLMEALIAYDDEDYAKAVELASSVRYLLPQMGGSHAQRDVFHLFLTHAAMKSPEKKHQNLCRSLIIERQIIHPKSQVNDRLMAKYLAAHGQ